MMILVLMVLDPNVLLRFFLFHLQVPLHCQHDDEEELQNQENHRTRTDQNPQGELSGFWVTFIGSGGSAGQPWSNISKVLERMKDVLGSFERVQVFLHCSSGSVPGPLGSGLDGSEDPFLSDEWKVLEKVQCVPAVRTGPTDPGRKVHGL